MISLVTSGKKAQLYIGPILPNPGPILPIAEAEAEIDVVKSAAEVKEITRAKIIKIKIYKR